MGSVEDHYSRLLAKHYTWMFGIPFAAKVAEQKAILHDALKSSADTSADCGRGLAVDLGSGPGFQALALAEMGYSPVLAIDTSNELLDQLRANRAGLPVETICSDISKLSELVSPATSQVVVCMGDTITHLESKDAVAKLFRSVTDSLTPGGTFVLSYRDLSRELTGTDRFIPVWSDDERVMTCFLEFDQPETVLVHDLVYSREGCRWRFEKSSYRKLRLPIDWLADEIESVGLTVDRGQAGRLVRLVGRKPY